MRDALLDELTARIREFHDSRAPGTVLDEAGVRAAAELMATVTGRTPDEPRDADVLYTVAAYYWARSVAHDEAALAAADQLTAMRVFGQLYLADRRRVPRPLWSRLTEVTGHDPWRDPVDHARDLVLDVREGGDPSALDEAMALLRDSPAGPSRDTTLGTAFLLRTAVDGRPPADRLADADAAVALLAGVAALPEERAAWRVPCLLSLAEAHTRRFELSADPADLTAAESAARAVYAEAPEGSAEQADAAAGLGAALSHRSDPAPAPEAAALLREAVQWLRLAVDLGADPERTSGARANLRRATRLLLERTAADPEPEPEPEAAASGGGAPLSPDDARLAADLGTLAAKVGARIVPEAEALRRVAAPAFPLSKRAVRSMVAAAALSVRSADPADAVPLLTLALEAAAGRWGRVPESPWWPAADVYVEAARLTLVGRPDGTLFRRAHDVVRTQIDVLRERADTDELAETLFAAGLLHLSPYSGERQGLSFDAAVDLWQKRWTRYAALHPEDPGAATGDMPPPSEAAPTAVGYLREAAALSSGHLSGRILKTLAEALSVVAGTRGESHDREILLAGRRAFDVLDPRRDPLGRLYVLRVLNLFGEVALPSELPGLLPRPLAAIRERQGEHEASCVLAEALTLAGEAGRPDLQALLLDAADRELPQLSSDSQRRRRWESEVHCLAGNRLECVPARMPLETVAAEVRSRAAAEGWPAEERAATLVHLAAHAVPAESGGVGSDLIAEAERSAPELFRRHADAFHFLDAVLAHDLGVTAVESRRPEAAARQFAWAAFQFGRCQQIDLALADLDTGLVCMRVCEGEAARQAAHALVPASVFLGRGTDETVEWKLRDLYQSLTMELAGSSVSLPLMSAVHQAAKGMAFTIATEGAGALPFSADLDRMLDLTRRAEAGLSGPLPDVDLPAPEASMLCYLGSGEAEPGGGAEAETRNQQRAADRWIGWELRTVRRPSRIPLLRLEEIQALLPEETVLLSLYLGQIRRPGSAHPVMALLGLAVTREQVEHRTVTFPDVEGGLLRISGPGHTLNVSPLASLVADLRQEVTADPLHRLVTRDGERSLAYDSRAYLAGFTELLPGWLAAGKSHLCLWPNGPLHYLPFPVLSVGGRPLADEWTVTQVPSLSFLPRPARSAGRAPRRGLAAFAFDSAGTDCLEEHAARVAASMGGAEPVLGPAATARRFLRELPGARYVHVAAHGSHNEWAPWYQCLFLAPDPAGDQDGRVFAHDILRTDLRGVELVTISACESALGRFDINDNLHGLPAAFLSAGAAAIVGCLWPVAPEVATAFFGTLYERLAVSPDRRDAFRTAQSATRARHPAYRDWGAFCFVGDWRSTTDAPHGATA